jgi:hypothetical protein
MAVERITVDAVEAAVVEFDAADRAVVSGSVVMDFTQIGVLASNLAPREWEEVAAYLLALLERAPLKDGRAYVAHRALIGAIAGELRGYARQAGEPVGLEVDLRGATSKTEEHRIRTRIADQETTFDRHVDDVIAQQHAQADAEAQRAAHDPQEEPTTTPAAAPPTDEPDADFLLS